MGDLTALCWTDYTKSLQLNPNNVKTYNNRGYSYAKKCEYDKAIKDYNRVLELDRRNTHAYHNRGISYDKKGEFLLAIRDFTKGTCVLAPRLAPSSQRIEISDMHRWWG